MYSENASSFPLSIFSTLVAIVLGVLMLLSYAIVEFYLFYDGAVDMQIWAVSDTQVTVKACRPLVIVRLLHSEVFT